MGLRKGDHATVVRDNYPNPDSRPLVGLAGVITGTSSGGVGLRPDGESQTLGFEHDEVEKTH
jgi:hypothetical protein